MALGIDARLDSAWSRGVSSALDHDLPLRALAPGGVGAGARGGRRESRGRARESAHTRCLCARAARARAEAARRYR